MNQLLINKFLTLPRSTKRIIMVLVDLLILLIAFIGSFFLHLDQWYMPRGEVAWVIIISPAVAIPLFYIFGLYQSVTRYIGFKVMWVIVKSVTLYTLITGMGVLLFSIEGVPRAVILINWMVLLILIGGSRMMARWWALGLLKDSDSSVDTDGSDFRKNIIIYGAGDAGVQLSAALLYSRELKPVAFIDDMEQLKGHQVNGLRVYEFSDLHSLIHRLNVYEVLLALPSVSRARRNNIITLLESYPVSIRTLPGIAEMAQGQVKISDLREVSVEDLLGRDPVPPDEKLLRSNIDCKVVMVTGAGGSIGSELCRQIILLNPKKLVLFEQSEFSLYLIEKELLNISPDSRSIQVIPVLGSVTNQDRIVRVCKKFGVQTIYHAAAYKHVPMVELNNTEGVMNNIFGTLYAVQSAVISGVETFVLISTDKAVRPTNTMGATKRFSELILQALALKYSQKEGAPCLSMVRFGNVLESSGSVIPLFKKQIAQGGPVTVTHPKIIRYFMTIPEAAQLVIQAGAMAKGGDVFVLDMGDPVLILDLAKKMIHLSGMVVKDEESPNGDIEIKFTGLRPGEKLYEELLIGDNVLPTNHLMIMKADEEMLSWDELEPILDDLYNAIQRYDHRKVRKLLIKAIPGFRPQCDISDYLFDAGNDSSPSDKGTVQNLITKNN